MTFHQTHHFGNSSTTSFTTPSPSSSSSLLGSSGRQSGSRAGSDLSFDLFNERGDYSETQFLKNSIANHTKYGSTAAIPTTHFQYITHYVEPMDTLQGLALRYGCKIENIKKCNKLFSDDNNYLRSRFTLLMPIECSKNASNSPLQSSSSSQESNSSLNGNIPLNSPTNHPLGPPIASSKSPMKHSMSSSQVQNPSGSSGSSKLAAKKQTSLCDPQGPQGPSSEPAEESIADFLIRIDSSIAASKREASKIVKKAQESGESTENPYCYNGTDEQLFKASSTSGSHFRSQNAKNARTKYRYEKAHDEIFEL